MSIYFFSISPFNVCNKFHVVGEGYRAPPKKSDKGDPKPVWVHAWKVDHGGDFPNTTIDGEI